MIEKIQNILDRHSVRSFQTREIELEKIELLKKAINNAATSINGQCFSAIFITNKQIKEKIGELNWEQKYIGIAPLFVVFLADFRRIYKASETQKKDLSYWTNSLEGFMTATIDAAIAATTLVDAATALDLGTCYIGGVRLYPDYLIETLDLPSGTIPIVGVVVGYEKNPPNPKIRLKVNKIYSEKYNTKQFDQELIQYNKDLAKYYEIRLKKNDETPPYNDFFQNTANTLMETIIDKDYDDYVHSTKKQKFLLKHL